MASGSGTNRIPHPVIPPTGYNEEDQVGQQEDDHEGNGVDVPERYYLAPDEINIIRQFRAQQKKPEQGDKSPTPSTDRKRRPIRFRFTMLSSSVNISTLKGAANWDRWYQLVYGCCQIAGVHHILTGQMTSPEDDDDYYNWDTANSWIEGNIRMSLESGGHAHIAGINGAFNMIKALQGVYKFKGYTFREVLWRIISRASLADYKGVIEYVEVIKKVKTRLAELGYHYSWEITTSFLHGLPLLYESFVEIILNNRGKDHNGRLLEPEFDDIVEQLLDRERRQKLTSTDSNSKAMVANGRNNNDRGSNRNRTNNSQYPKCDDCGSRHGEVCWVANPDKASEGWADRFKDRIEEFRKKKNEKENPSERSKIPKAACAKTLTINRDSGWYFDNAASFHMSYSEAYFIDEPRPLENPISVETADGRLL